MAASARRPPEDLRNRRVSAEGAAPPAQAPGRVDLEERLATPGLDPRRADLVGRRRGAARHDRPRLGADEFTLCDLALREGLVLDYIQRNSAHIRKVERYPDVRRRSVVELAERCGYWPEHAQQVARLALRIFDQTRERARLGPIASASGSSSARCCTTSACTSATSATTSTRTT